MRIKYYAAYFLLPVLALGVFGCAPSIHKYNAGFAAGILAAKQDSAGIQRDKQTWEEGFMDGYIHQVRTKLLEEGNVEIGLTKDNLLY